MSRIIDPVFVDEDGTNQSAKLNQRVPVAPIASQSGRLDREHGTDAEVSNIPLWTPVGKLHSEYLGLCLSRLDEGLAAAERQRLASPGRRRLDNDE